MQCSLDNLEPTEPGLAHRDTRKLKRHVGVGDRLGEHEIADLADTGNQLESASAN